MQLSEYKSWECGRGRVRHNTEMHCILCLLVTVMNISGIDLWREWLVVTDFCEQQAAAPPRQDVRKKI